jgi:cellulose synthase/poly-beta-1,6-N-acetylglucosamine synthase-like glycosyltransferase
MGWPLPVEIGFLVGRGCSVETLQYAAAIAAVTCVPADEVMLKHRLISDSEFYRALADELALPFIATPRLGQGTHFPNSILAGLAPLAGPRGGFVLAPRGSRLRRLLTTRRPPQGLSITTPRALAKAVLHQQFPAITQRAAHQLSNQAPHFSARDGGTRLQLACLCVLAMLLSFGAVQAPALVLITVSVALAPLFLIMVGLRLAAAAMHHPATELEPAVRASEAALPVYSVIVALYREPLVVAALVAALSRLDYPAVKLDIKLVIEADDDETARALGGLVLLGFIDVIVAPPGLPRTKPRALNVALPPARGAFTVVYDAEDAPDPGQLRLAVAAFADQPAQIACLQARLVIDNTDDTWLTRLFTIEYASLFDVINPGLAALDSPVPLGGTSNHFRTSALRNALGWDAWNVTEDADLGIRLARLGYRVGDLRSATWEEAPRTVRAWMRQRRRWMKGFIQTCVTHSRAPAQVWRELGAWRFSAALTLTFGTILSALGYPLYFTLSLVGIVRGHWLATESYLAALWSLTSVALFGLGLAAITIPACVALARRRLWRLLPWVPLLPFYYMLVSAAAAWAIWELVTDPYCWNKTDHGLARTSRARAVRAALPGPWPPPPESD